MDRAKLTYLLVGVNVVVGVCVVIFLVMQLFESGPGAGTRAAREAGVPSAAPERAGEAGPREAAGPAPVERAPRVKPPVTEHRVALLPAGESRVSEPPRLPEDTERKIRETRWLLKGLVLRCELYRSRRGAYPPSEIDAGNDENEGIEALYAFLVEDGLLDAEDTDGWVGNTDGDVFGDDFVLSGRRLGGEERRELLDAWGNPLVYFRHDRYPTEASYRTGGGKAKPQVSRLAEEYQAKRVIEEHRSRKDVVEYHARDFVQIWSAGPNGENENGGGDDVTSWHIRE